MWPCGSQLHWWLHRCGDRKGQSIPHSPPCRWQHCLRPVCRRGPSLMYTLCHPLLCIRSESQLICMWGSRRGWYIYRVNVRHLRDNRGNPSRVAMQGVWVPGTCRLFASLTICCSPRLTKFNHSVVVIACTANSFVVGVACTANSSVVGVACTEIHAWL